MRFLAGLLLGLAACTSSASETGDPFLHYTSSGGFTGAGEGVTLDIADTGHVVRTTASGRDETDLAPGDLADLQALIDAAQFRTLEPAYLTNDPDWYRFELTHGSYTVLVDEDAPDAPAALHALIDHLRAEFPAQAR